MTVNMTKYALEKRQAQAIKTANSGVVDLKTKQNTGGDAIVVATSGLHKWIVTASPGQTRRLIVSYYSNLKTLSIDQLRPSFFIDNDADFNYQWPIGASLSSDQYLFERSIHADTELSNELVDGTSTWVLTVTNLGTSSKTIYTYYELLYPHQTVVAL